MSRIKEAGMYRQPRNAGRARVGATGRVVTGLGRAYFRRIVPISGTRS
jgi:hypothetical protein